MSDRAKKITEFDDDEFAEDEFDDEFDDDEDFDDDEFDDDEEEGEMDDEIRQKLIEQGYDLGDDIDDVNDDSLFVFVILEEDEDEEDEEEILCVFVNAFEEAENLRVCVIFK